jgi:hypothetical protein
MNLEKTIYPMKSSFNISINLSSKKTSNFLFKVIFILCTLSLIGQFSFYFLPDFPMRDVFIQKFNVDEEMNFPTLFSFLMLITSSGLLKIIHLSKEQVGQSFIKEWKMLSAIFLYLGLDEMLALHERLMPSLRSMGASGFLYNAWVIPFGLFVIIFCFNFFRFWINLDAPIRTLFLVAFILYVSGALGFELIDGLLTYKAETNTFLYSVASTIEDGLEMIGISIFIRGLLTYLNSIDIRSARLDLN